MSIERTGTGIRILLSILFMIIAEVASLVLRLLAIFALGYTLMTKQPPSEPVIRFGNHGLSYLYRLFRYLTYNESEPPFPFSDFPSEIEAPRPIGDRVGDTPP